jgi:hypothetical protein
MVDIPFETIAGVSPAEVGEVSSSIIRKAGGRGTSFRRTPRLSPSSTLDVARCIQRGD